MVVCPSRTRRLAALPGEPLPAVAEGVLHIDGQRPRSGSPGSLRMPKSRWPSTSAVGRAAALIALILAGVSVAAWIRPALAGRIPFGQLAAVTGYLALAVGAATSSEAHGQPAQFKDLAVHIDYHYGYGAYLGMGAALVLLAVACALLLGELVRNSSVSQVAAHALVVGLLASFLLPWARFGPLTYPGVDDSPVIVAAALVLRLSIGRLRTHAGRLAFSAVAGLFVMAAISSDRFPETHAYGAWVGAGLALALVVISSAEWLRMPGMRLPPRHAVTNRSRGGTVCRRTLHAMAKNLLHSAERDRPTALRALPHDERLGDHCRRGRGRRRARIAHRDPTSSRDGDRARSGIGSACRHRRLPTGERQWPRLRRRSRVRLDRQFRRRCATHRIGSRARTSAASRFASPPQAASTDRSLCRVRRRSRPAVVGRAPAPNEQRSLLCAALLADDWGALVGIHLLFLWFRRVADNADWLVGLPLFLLALAAVDLIAERSRGISWGGGIIVGLSLVLALIGYVEQQGGLRNLRLPEIMRVDRIEP